MGSSPESVSRWVVWCRAGRTQDQVDVPGGCSVPEVEVQGVNQPTSPRLGPPLADNGYQVADDRSDKRARYLRPAAKELQRRWVDLWREQASTVSGMKRGFFLERALEHARVGGEIHQLRGCLGFDTEWQ